MSTNCESRSTVPASAVTALRLHDPGGPVKWALPLSALRPKRGALITSENGDALRDSTRDSTRGAHGHGRPRPACRGPFRPR